MNITSNIYQVGGSSESHPSDAAVYLIKDKNEAAIIDAGTGKGTDRIIKNISGTATGPEQITYLFITHCHFDHTGGIHQLQEWCQCKTVAHELDAEYIESGNSEVTAASWYGTFMEPTAIDIKVTERQKEFQVGDITVTLHHTPGHSPGSSVLTLTSDKKLVLFGQDVHGPLNDALLSVRSDYIESLEFLLSLEADILCEGHFGVYSGKEKVRNFIESFL